MAEPTLQTYANHARLDPPFHLFLLPVAGLTLGLAVYDLVTETIKGTFSIHTIWFLVLAIAFAIAILKIRTYALKVQDRVIRLEERLRLATLCSDPLRGRIGELTEGQLIAIRFASDAEVPGLVEKALTNKLAPKEIKQAVKNWRADTFRV